MCFIETISPDQATDCVEILYQRLQGSKNYLPNYARVFCHRPTLMAQIATLMEALRGTMSPRLWSLVNLAAARASHSSYCSLAFANTLIGKHFSEQELLLILRDDEQAPLTATEKAAMHYAGLVATDASRICREDVATLKACGLSDAEIFDVTAAAAWRCFFARVPDALGARADESLTRLDAALLQRLLVGRPAEANQHAAEHPGKARPELPG
ncbi:peroxidase [Seongchinamella unica]|uniref:Peroxidase n=1 Tax=Seongchinamella unica TaxID=2547392 RepID=A0A4R5LVC5_9GAMM|nr:carboxymuconolactone decarboxylase family protein [Seongchinamella unica]TDG15394.1 peroxidase [Seongchinamella unica]